MWRTVNYQAAYRGCASAWQLLIKWLTGANEVADRCWSTGWQVLIKLLTDASQVADRHWSGACMQSKQRNWGRKAKSVLRLQIESLNKPVTKHLSPFLILPLHLPFVSMGHCCHINYYVLWMLSAGWTKFLWNLHLEIWALSSFLWGCA